MKFSEFAKILFSIVGGKKYEFTIELLKAGLNDNGVDFIKSLRSDVSGKSRIRKFLSGENDITEIAPEIVNYFEFNLFAEYLEEIIDESKYCEICEEFRNAFNDQIIIEEDDVPQRLAEIYYDILNEAAKGKSAKVKSNASVDNTKTTNDTVVNSDIVQAYTITESEKNAIKNMCKLINGALRNIKQMTAKIDQKQVELKKITNSESDQRWKVYLECELKRLNERLNAEFSKLEDECKDIVKILESKKHLNVNLNKIYDIACGIGKDEYKITHPDAFRYNAFSLMVSDFERNFNMMLKSIDKL